MKMASLTSGLAVAIFGGACLSQLQAGEKNITIDSTKRYQTITGLGAMLYPYSLKYDDPKFPEMFARDIGCSIARMEISPELLKEAPGDMDAFLSDPIDKTIGQMNFKARAISIVGDVIKPIVDKKLDEMKLVASVWSPPKWMKDNNDTKRGGRLLPDRREHFAKYLAAFCKGFEKTYGVPVFALSIQNELRFVEPYNSCVYKEDTSDYHDAVLAVAKAFKKYDVKTKLFGPEHMGSDSKGKFFYGHNMKYIGQIAKDPETLDMFMAWAFHGYAADGMTQASSKKGWQDYYGDLASHKKELWMSETSGAQPEWIHQSENKSRGDRPDGALTIGLNVHDALVAGNLNAWIFWSFQDGDKLTQYNLTCKGDLTAKKYNAAKQYFRFIRPGAVRLDASPDNYDMNVCVFLHETHKTLTVVLTNMEKEEHKVNITVPANLKVASFKGFRTSEKENFHALEDIAITGGKASLPVPPESIVTLVGSCGGDLKAFMTDLKTDVPSSPAPTPVPQAVQPNPGSTMSSSGASTAQETPAQADSPAAKDLQRARDFADNGMNEKAKDLLKKIIQQCAGSDEAKQAQKMLDKMK
ncbi:MAG: hypothetical protein HZA50_01075 [Planctomycetes bacterium]|nr:hypothetical protein [Planctomycetota bacterium]